MIDKFVLLPMFFLPWNVTSLDVEKAEERVSGLRAYLVRHGVPFRALYIMATRIPKDQLSPEFGDQLSDDVRNWPMMPGSQEFIDDIWNEYEFFP